MRQQQRRLRSDSARTRPRLLPRRPNQRVQPEPPEQCQLLRNLQLHVGLMIARGDVEEIVR